MVTVDTVKKSSKNAVLAKYAANYWLTYDRSVNMPLISNVHFNGSTNFY